jgi:hypothetical protein
MGMGGYGIRPYANGSTLGELSKALLCKAYCR